MRATESAELNQRIAEAVVHWEDMSDEDRERMLRDQGESYARSIRAARDGAWQGGEFRIDQQMTEYDVLVLRELNGEAPDGVIAGAALWTSASWLKKRGYAEGFYEITDRGRAYLRGLDAMLKKEGANG